MTYFYDKKLCFEIWKIDIKAQKINNFTFKIFIKIVIAGFQILKKLNRVYFFKKIFLLANISIDIIFEMFFLIFSNTNILFIDWKFI